MTRLAITLCKTGPVPLDKTTSIAQRKTIYSLLSLAVTSAAAAQRRPMRANRIALILGFEKGEFVTTNGPGSKL